MNPAHGPANRRLLVVDDNRAIHDDFRKILGGAAASRPAMAQAEAALFGPRPGPGVPRFEVESAVSGEEALAAVTTARAAGRPFALAFVDIRMAPGWDGLATTEQLWRADPALQVVVCTAYSDYSWEDFLERLTQHDRLLILKKPFDPIEVRQLAVALTEKWNLAQQLQNQLDQLEAQVQERTQALEQSLSLTRATLEATADGLLVISRDGRVTTCNQRFLDLWGLPRDLPGVSDAGWLLHWLLQQLKPPHAFPTSVATLAEPVEAVNRVETLTLSNGRSFEFVAQPQRIGEDGVGHVWSFRDVTERQLIQGRRFTAQKLETIGRLAGGVAHDFNNLLTIMTGYSGLLLEQLRPQDQQRPLVQQIHGAAERGAALVRQLLAFGRRQLLRPVAMDLNALVTETLHLLGRLLGEHIEIQTDLHPALGSIRADPAQIQQVLMNLALNARDAMPHGGQLSFQTRLVELAAARTIGSTEAPAGAYAVVTVTDTGCGMTDEVLAHLFEPFFTTKEVGKGTGLGLAMVYGTMQQSNGYIAVESKVQQGTTFRLYFPQVAEAVMPAAAPLRPSPRCHAGGTVLLVEDDAVVRGLAQRVLEDNRYRVLPAANGAEALALLESGAGTVKLAVIDLVLPRMSGARLGEQLKRAHPQLKVLYVSGYPEESLVEHDQPKQRNLVLEKPYTPERLLHALEQLQAS